MPLCYPGRMRTSRNVRFPEWLMQPCSWEGSCICRWGRSQEAKTSGRSWKTGKVPCGDALGAVRARPGMKNVRTLADWDCQTRAGDAVTPSPRTNSAVGVGWTYVGGIRINFIQNRRILGPLSTSRSRWKQAVVKRWGLLVSCTQRQRVDEGKEF